MNLHSIPFRSARDLSPHIRARPPVFKYDCSVCAGGWVTGAVAAAATVAAAVGAVGAVAAFAVVATFVAGATLGTALGGRVHGWPGCTGPADAAAPAASPVVFDWEWGWGAVAGSVPGSFAGPSVPVVGCDWVDGGCWLAVAAGAAAAAG